MVSEQACDRVDDVMSVESALLWIPADDVDCGKNDFAVTESADPAAELRESDDDKGLAGDGKRESDVDDDGVEGVERVCVDVVGRGITDTSAWGDFL